MTPFVAKRQTYFLRLSAPPPSLPACLPLTHCPIFRLGTSPSVRWLPCAGACWMRRGTCGTLCPRGSGRWQECHWQLLMPGRSTGTQVRGGGREEQGVGGMLHAWLSYQINVHQAITCKSDISKLAFCMKFLPECNASQLSGSQFTASVPEPSIAFARTWISRCTK